MEGDTDEVGGVDLWKVKPNPGSAEGLKLSSTFQINPGRLWEGDEF